MKEEFRQGDRVQWHSGSGKATGTIINKVTESTEIAGNSVKATPEDPRYLVENDNTEKVTGHKGQTLAPLNDNLTVEQQKILQDFHKAVNMSAPDLQQWLHTEQSKSVGQMDDDGEAIGHKSGRRIVEILVLNDSDYTEADFSQMKRVIGYVHRHLAQKPSGDIENSRWRYSLMNWGHDPLKG